MKKYVITWFDGEECREAKFYAHDKEEAELLAAQFIDDKNAIIEEL